MGINTQASTDGENFISFPAADFAIKTKNENKNNSDNNFNIKNKINLDEKNKIDSNQNLIVPNALFSTFFENIGKR